MVKQNSGIVFWLLVFYWLIYVIQYVFVLFSFIVQERLLNILLI